MIAVSLFEAITGQVVTLAAFVAAMLYLIVRVRRASQRLVKWGRALLDTLRAIEVLGERIADHDARITKLEVRSHGTRVVREA